jgi:signal transduction histidine kinase
MNRADVGCVLLATCGGIALLATRAGSVRGAGPGIPIDITTGAISVAAIGFRRRWPVGVGLLTAVTQVFSLSSGAAALVAVCNVGIRRRTAAAIEIAVLHQATMIGYFYLWRPGYPFWAFWAVSMSEQIAVLVFGMYLRARGQLIGSLHDRVAQAEATQQAMADQARLAERARIAGEMHDVLAHRVSLIALHAGALEIRPDQSPDSVRETAGLIRQTARQALTELRDVIGVLELGASRTPQPTLETIASLVGEYQRAGLNVALEMNVPDLDDAPGPLGRDAYRIVREGLANVTKHARGTQATVSVSGQPGDGLRITIRNKLPLAQRGPALPGSGLGLVGLAERVAVAGGTLTHGPGPGGDFVLSAGLRWESVR